MLSMLLMLLGAFKGELGLVLVRTFIARGIAAFGGVMLFIVLGRLYGAEGVGVFALAQSIYLGAGILARYGMDNPLMRYVGQDPKSTAVAVYLRWALTKSTFISTIAAVIIYLSSDLFAPLFKALPLPCHHDLWEGLSESSTITILDLGKATIRGYFDEPHRKWLCE